MMTPAQRPSLQRRQTLQTIAAAAAGLYFGPSAFAQMGWTPSQSDVLAIDWMIVT